MKRILAFMLAVLLAVMSFAACSSDSEKKDKDLAASENSDDPEIKIGRGKIYGDVFSNAYCGLEFNKPSDWVYSDDEQLAALVNASMEQINVPDMSKTLAELGSVYDMMAQDTVTNSNVIVMLEDLSVTNMGKMITEEEYVEALKTNLPIQTGIGYEFEGMESVSLSGMEYLKGTFSVEVESTVMNQAYYVRAVDDSVMSVVVITAVSGTDIESIEDMFI